MHLERVQVSFGQKYPDDEDDYEGRPYDTYIQHADNCDEGEGFGTLRSDNGHGSVYEYKLRDPYEWWRPKEPGR